MGKYHGSFYTGKDYLRQRLNSSHRIRFSSIFASYLAKAKALENEQRELWYLAWEIIHCFVLVNFKSRRQANIHRHRLDEQGLIIYNLCQSCTSLSRKYHSFLRSSPSKSTRCGNNGRAMYTTITIFFSCCFPFGLSSLREVIPWEQYSRVCYTKYMYKKNFYSLVNGFVSSLKFVFPLNNSFNKLLQKSLFDSDNNTWLYIGFTLEKLIFGQCPKSYVST